MSASLITWAGASPRPRKPLPRCCARPPSGLLYLDDGSSPRSLAGELAPAARLAFARADLAIDSAAKPAEIDQALQKLEALARERGSAVATATVQPAVIERIAQWAKEAESRGFALVPVSVIAKPKAGDAARTTEDRRRKTDKR